ncbi:hypothetical protein [Lacrimispora indolis]|uniref:hypothetical protein n=1 Tax=Lacrimispora indolis TaxID=69825 RepID=UPI00045EB1FA|nr:hypothetical protein [Lacrimispora indolis]MBE7718810.1 hypothetical protein [Lacrimispora celerecrescens]
MKAKKENKVYTITETEKKRYLDTGYDIYGDDGELIEHSPLKKITVAEHEKEVFALKEENAALKAQLAEKEKLAKEKAKAGE